MHACMRACWPWLIRACALCGLPGLGLRVEGHQWIPEDSFCYEMQGSPHDLEVCHPCSAPLLRKPP
jgi:hypothetical protein